MPQEITGEADVEIGVDMQHHRQAENADHSTVLIALPGAYEKLDDLLWLLPSAPPDIHHKPVGLLNEDGCYDSLLSDMDRGVKKGFISAKSRRVIVSAPTAKELLKKLEEYVLRLEEESIQYRLEMQKLIQDPGLDITSEGLETLKNKAVDINEEFFWQVPFPDENDIDTVVDQAASDLKSANVRLHHTVALVKWTQNFWIDIAALCCILGMAAYLYSVLKK